MVGDSAAGVLAYYILGGLSCRRIFAEIEDKVALRLKDFVSGLVYSLFL